MSKIKISKEFAHNLSIYRENNSKTHMSLSQILECPKISEVIKELTGTQYFSYLPYYKTSIERYDFIAETNDKDVNIKSEYNKSFEEINVLKSKAQRGLYRIEKNHDIKRFNFEGELRSVRRTAVMYFHDCETIETEENIIVINKIYVVNIYTDNIPSENQDKNYSDSE